MTAIGETRPHSGPAPARPELHVALIGNPNTGKSTLFGALSGVQQRVANYPGVTVEKKLGQLAHRGRRWTLIDLPGTYSLAPRSPDEMVAVDVLLGRRDDVAAPDAVVCVVDADNLERNLYLVSQVLELGRPTVVALTMLDVARSRGVAVDVERLGRQLGVPVVPVQAQRRDGLDALKDAVEAAANRPATEPARPFPEAFRAEVESLHASLASHGLTPPRYLVERLLLDTSGYIADRLVPSADRPAIDDALRTARARLAEAGAPVPAVEAMARYGWVARVAEGVVAHPEVPRRTAGDRLDAVLTHRAWGTLVLAAVLLLIFHAVFTWAQTPMGWIEAGLAWASDTVAASMPFGPLRSLLIDGVIGGIGAIIIFLPQILILFFFLAILEDCGYLARAAYLMDRLMVRVGLSGKSCIPLLSSFACAIPGVMATRVIENRRDRLVTILVAPLMSCSARLPVYALMIAAFIPNRPVLGRFLGLQGLVLFAMYAVGIVVAAAVAWLLKRTVLRGPTPPFVMELPAYRWPSWRVVTFRVLERGWEFLRRAGTVIFAVSVVMWAVLHYPQPDARTLAPLLAEHTRLGEAIDASADPEARGALESERADLESRIETLTQQRSLLARAGHALEPLVRPLGWDWRIGAAVLASFPAREVVVAGLGVIFDVGREAAEDEGDHRLRDALRSATWGGTNRPLFNVPVALSLMVFFALCAQCVSTLAVIRRETNSWAWPAFSFAYMTAIAYLGAFVTYHVGMLL
jgi:ferrous iron transport protein B